ncbi:MAG: hypothetical protein RIQ74_198 [Pseudomonadota bacterium]|jgi:hypothetical protein
MLMTTQNLPMNNGGIPWGTIAIATIIIGGLGYMTYTVVNQPKTIKKPNPES